MSEIRKNKVTISILPVTLAQWSIYRMKPTGNIL